MPEARIDKWMWAVRIFKTRTIAAEACKKGRVSINGSFVKAARMIKPGDVIQVKKPPIRGLFCTLPAGRAHRPVLTGRLKVPQPLRRRILGDCVPRKAEF